MFEKYLSVLISKFGFESKAVTDFCKQVNENSDDIDILTCYLLAENAAMLELIAE